MSEINKNNSRQRKIQVQAVQVGSDFEMEIPEVNDQAVELKEVKVRRKGITSQAKAEKSSKTVQQPKCEKRDARKQSTGEPKVIKHGSRLITSRSSLPKAPEPVMLDRVREVALADRPRRYMDIERAGRGRQQAGVAQKSGGVRAARQQVVQRETERNVRVSQQMRQSVQTDMVRGLEQRGAVQAETIHRTAQSTAPYRRQIDMVRVRQQVRQGVVQQPVQVKPTAKQLKEQAIQQAVLSANRQVKGKPAKQPKLKFGAWRVLLALSCAAAAAFGIVYLVENNSSTAPMKVAAMQSGIEASYPSYVPRDFDLSDITSENGKITLNFRNAMTGDAFTLIEEEVSAQKKPMTLEEYVASAFGKDYTLVQEAGVPVLYIGGSDAAWETKGVLYKLKMVSGSFTKKQITNIAKSV